MKTNIKRLGIFILFFAAIVTTLEHSADCWVEPDRVGIIPGRTNKVWPVKDREMLLESVDIGKEYLYPVNVML